MPRHVTKTSFKSGKDHIGWNGGTSDYWRREARKIVDCPKGFIVHHKNGDYSDNRKENLEILTQSEHIKKHNLHDIGHKVLMENIKNRWDSLKVQVDLLSNEGFSSREIAKFFNVGKTTILRIRRYKNE